MGYGGGGGGGGGSGGSGGGGGGYTTVGGGSAFGGSDEFELPSYNQAPAGSIRFNTDSKKLEVYILDPVGYGTLPNGIWMEVDSWSPQLQTGGTRALFGGGHTHPARSDIIDYINVDSAGNAIDFGNLIITKYQTHACASRVRAYWAGGEGPSTTKAIDTVVIASTGNATDYGDLVNNVRSNPGISNSTRGFSIAGENPGSVNMIEYFALTSTGSGIDFGDTIKDRTGPFAVSNSTRGVYGGGRDSSPATLHGDIEFITLSTLGNGADFGDLDQSVSDFNNGNISNSVRGLACGGYNHPGSPISYYDYIQYITIPTLGNAQDFGDLTDGRQAGGAASSPTRGVNGGGHPGGGAPNNTDTIDYVQLMTTGNAVDFGNLTDGRRAIGGCSNGHGGL
jgi:hypothetical protein